MAVAFPFFEDKIVVRYEEDTMDFNEDLFVKFNTRLARFPFFGNEVNNGVICLEVGLAGASGEIVILVGWIAPKRNCGDFDDKIGCEVKETTFRDTVFSPIAADIKEVTSIIMRRSGAVFDCRSTQVFVVSSELNINGIANEKETPADELAEEFTLLVEDSSAGRVLKYSYVNILSFCDTEVRILPAGLTPEDVKNCVGCDNIKLLTYSFPVDLLCSLVKICCAYIDEGVS